MSPVDRDSLVMCSYGKFQPARASGHSFVDLSNFASAAKGYYTFEMENSADEPKCCHRGR